MIFEIGKLMYQQNRFKTCCEVFGDLINKGTTFDEHYFTVFAQGYILRSKLRMGSFDLKGLEALVSLAESKQFISQDYLELVMDLG